MAIFDSLILKYIAWFTALSLTAYTVNSDDPLSPPQLTCNYYSCGTSNEKLTNIKITYVPDPPRLNENVTIYFSGYLSEEIDSGTARMKAYFGTREVFDKSLDLCSNLSPVNLSCPFYPGPLKFKYASRVPPAALPGIYSTAVTLTNGKNEEVACMKLFCSIINKR